MAEEQDEGDFLMQFDDGEIQLIGNLEHLRGKPREVAAELDPDPRDLQVVELGYERHEPLGRNLPASVEVFQREAARHYEGVRLEILHEIGRLDDTERRDAPVRAALTGEDARGEEPAHF